MEGGEGLLVKPEKLPSLSGVSPARSGLPLLVGARTGAMALMKGDMEFDKVYDILKDAQTAARHVVGKGLWSDPPGADGINVQAARVLRAELAHLLALGVQVD